MKDTHSFHIPLIDNLKFFGKARGLLPDNFGEDGAKEKRFA